MNNARMAITNGRIRQRDNAPSNIHTYQIDIVYGHKRVEKNGKIKNIPLRKYYTIRNVSLRTAKRFMAAQQRMLEEMHCVASKGEAFTLRQWNETWLNDWAKAIEESTRMGYREKLSYFSKAEKLGDILIEQLDAEMLQRFFNRLAKGSGQHKPLSPRTLRHLYSTQKQALQKAVALGLLPANPLQEVVPPKVQTAPRKAYSAETLKYILQKAQEDGIELTLSLFVLTGMRRGEVCGLRFEDVDFEKRELKIAHNRVRGEHGVIEKTPKSINGFRTIPVPGQLIALLQGELERQKAERLPCKHVLINKQGEPLKPDSLTRLWLRFLARHPEIPATNLHGIRHSHVSLLVNNGTSIPAVAYRIGDTVKTAMDVYSHTDEAATKYAGNKIEELLCS